MHIINKLIRRLGRENYSIDKIITKREMASILLSKSFCLLRGYLLRLTLKKSNGLLFIGRRCNLIFRNKISIGKTVTLGDNVEINALSRSGVSIGNNVSILKNTIIECTGVLRCLGEGLIIGNNVGIAQNCFIQVRGKVIIGNNVIFGPNVSIISENHNFDKLDRNISQQGETRKGVVIEDGVWLGTRAVILDGVRVGANSIVAAGSIVTQDVLPNTIVGGVPARLIKNRI